MKSVLAVLIFSISVFLLGVILLFWRMHEMRDMDKGKKESMLEVQKEDSLNPSISKEEQVFQGPTNFAEVGTLVFNNPGLKQNTPYLVYEKPGSPALTKEIVFDPLSICMANSGATPCIAMNVTLDVPFGGKQVVIEGVAQGDVVLLRKMRIVDAGEVPRIPQTGSIFISWQKAVELIEQCKIEMIMQTHALDVYLNLRDGTRVRAVEPLIDEVFKITERAQVRCGSIPSATE